MPGLGALNAGGNGHVYSVSCASAGNCAADGYYTDAGYPADRGSQGFVADERNGRWGKATEVPGLETLNKTADASLFSVSCGSAGNCAAGGYYTNGGYFSDRDTVGVTAGQLGEAQPEPLGVEPDMPFLIGQDPPGHLAGPTGHQRRHDGPEVGQRDELGYGQHHQLQAQLQRPPQAHEHPVEPAAGDQPDPSGRPATMPGARHGGG